jgi:hypothetical protein
LRILPFKTESASYGIEAERHLEKWPRIGPDPLTQARFTWYIRNPSGGMPPYTDVVISDQDLADIHAFLKTRTQPPALEDIPLLAP